jgi:hypothetical protein
MSLQCRFSQQERRRPLPADLNEALGHPIRFFPLLSRLCENVAAGMMLSQAIYWTQVTQDPDGWFYKTSAQWQRETTLSGRQQMTARAALSRFPFWQEVRRGLTGRLHYRVDHDELLRAVLALPGRQEKAFRDSTKARNKERRSSESRLHKSAKHNKEAESTSETTKAITPTPLFTEDDNANSSVDRNAVLSRFWVTLKTDLMTGPLISAALDDDWDLYFRDMWIRRWADGVVYMAAKDPESARKALLKYGRRLRATFFEVTGERVEFKLEQGLDRTGPS